MEVRGLRVAHLIECDGPGGAERMMAHLAVALQIAGAHNVAILPANGEGWLARQLQGSGVEVEYFRLPRPLSPASARWLTRTFRRHRLDIVHSHEFSMSVYGSWAAWRSRIPHVITMHGGHYYAGRLRRRVALRTAIAMSGCAAAVSARLAGDLRRDLWLTGSRVVTIPNGVRYEPPGRITLRDELRLHADDRLAVAVGNLYPVKGHQFAVDAVALLADRHPTLHLAIAGRGDLADALAAHAQQRGVAERVHLLGLRADIPAVLAAADVFVMPSLSEASPLALLEAMFAGCPIVASEVGEVGAALAGGAAGMLVAPGDAVALAAALDRVLSDPRAARELGIRAAVRARAEHDLSRMVHRYAGIYQDLLRNRSYRPLTSQPQYR
jgi:glycosyltransferase involved in cell wall biosynthesis